MESLDRMAIIVLPKAPYVAWVCKQPAADDGLFNVTLLDFAPFAFLVDDAVGPKEMVFRRNHVPIFEDMLEDYNTDRSAWPALTFENFQEWFDATLAEIVVDVAAHKRRRESS